MDERGQVLDGINHIFVLYFNNHRWHAALGYKSPVQYKTEPGFP